MFIFYPLDNCSAWIRPINRAFWAEVTLDKDFTSITCSTMINGISYYSLSSFHDAVSINEHIPVRIWQRLVHEVHSARRKKKSVSRISKQLCFKCVSSVTGSKVTGFRIQEVLRITFWLASKMVWYFPRIPAVSQKPPLCFCKVKSWWDTHRVIGCLRVKLPAFCRRAQ